MSGLFVCLYAHVFLMPLEAKESLRSPGTRVIDDCKPPYSFWEANLGSLREQPVFLMTGLSF